MAASSSTVERAQRLDDLEQSILRTIETLDRIEEFTQPSLKPDNEGLAVNLCAAVSMITHARPTHLWLTGRRVIFLAATRW